MNIPEGWKLVPVEPTPEMKERGKGYLGMNTDMPAEVWKDMLSASPTPPEVDSHSVVDNDGCKEAIDYVDRGYMLLDHFEDKLGMVGSTTPPEVEPVTLYSAAFDLCTRIENSEDMEWLEDEVVAVRAALHSCVTN
jgi:hypothetical protein